MNNHQSLYYFTPEIILFVNVILAFVLSDVKSRNIRMFQNILLGFSIGAAIFVNLIFRAGRPYGLFNNFFAIGPFSVMLSIFLLVLFFIFDLKQNLSSDYSTDLRLQTLIMLVASTILLKVNSLMSLIFCVGLVYNNMLTTRFTDKTENSNKGSTYSLIKIQLLSFGFLCIGLTILFGQTGSLFMHSVVHNSGMAADLSLSFSVAAFFLIIGFGIFGFLLPFETLYNRPSRPFKASYYNSSYFLPLLAFWGLSIRLFARYLPINAVNGSISVNSMVILGLSICLILAANLYWPVRNNQNNIFVIALIIHFGLSISGIAINNPDTQAASVYLLMTTILILSGLAFLNQDNSYTRVNKLARIFFLLALIGFPGSSGFIGRFMLLRSFFSAGAPVWSVILLILGLLPIIYYLTLEILRVYEYGCDTTFARTDIIPVFLAAVVFFLGIYWAPLFKLITNSIVFFQ